MPSDDEEFAAGGRALSPVVISAISANFVIFVFSRLFQLAFIAVMARRLSPAEFGVAAAATLFVSFAQISASFGVGAALIQARNVNEHELSAANTFAVCSALAFTLAAVATAPLAGQWFHDPQVIAPARVIALAVLAQGFMVVPQSVLSRQLRARDLSLIELASTIIGSAGVALPLAIGGLSYWSIIMGTVVQAISKAIFLMAVTKHGFRPNFDMAVVRGLTTRGGGYFLFFWISRLSAEMDRLVVGRYLGAPALGFYGRAAAVSALPGVVYAAVIDRVTLPAFARVQAEPERLLAAYRNGLSLIAVAGMPMTVCLVAAGPSLIRLLLGPGWDPAVAAFELLSLAAYFRLNVLVSGTLLRSVGRPYLLSAIQAVVGAAIGVAGLLLWPHGIAAVAGAVACISLAEFLVTTCLGCWQAGLRMAAFVHSQAHGLAGAAICALALWPAVKLGAAFHLSTVAQLALIGAVLAIVAGLAVAIIPDLVLGAVGREAVGLLTARTPWTRRSP